MQFSNIGPLLVVNVGDWTALVAPSNAALLSVLVGYPALLTAMAYLANRKQPKPAASTWAGNNHAWHLRKQQRRSSGWTISDILDAVTSLFN